MALSKGTNRKEVWGDQQADMKCDAPCRSPRGKGSSFKNATTEHLDERRQDWRGTRSSRRVFPAKTRDPFESGTIQSEVPRLWKESLLHRPGLAGWYILFYSTHAHIHSSEMPSLYSQSSRPPEADDASTSGGGSTASYTAWKTLLQSLVSNWRCLQASSNRKNHILK